MEHLYEQRSTVSFRLIDLKCLEDRAELFIAFFEKCQYFLKNEMKTKREQNKIVKYKARVLKILSTNRRTEI